MRTTFRMLLFGLLLLSFGGTARAQAPAAGQPYQVPSGYEAYGPGTLINYGGYSYVIQDNGTMLLAANSQPSGDETARAQASAAGQPYQVPSGYETYGPGTLINYGGYNYVIQSNGTMLLAANSQPSQPGQTYQQTQYTQPSQTYQPQYTYQQPQYSQPSQTYQQPQYTYQQPQYSQPSQTYQPQYTYQPPTNGGMSPGGSGVAGVGGGRTLGNSNVAQSV